ATDDGGRWHGRLLRMPIPDGTIRRSRSSGGMKTATRLAALAGVAAVGLGLAAAARLASRHPVGNPGVPQPRKPVDLSKYLGRWHELARYEQRYQKGCDGVTADYTLRADGDIQVTNRCRRDDGAMSEAIGHAKVVDTTTRAKLKVSF